VSKLESERTWYKFSSKTINICFLLAFCVLHAAAQDTPGREPAEALAAPPPTIEPFGARYAAVAAAPSQQARIVLYRPGTQAQAEPVNIYLNGRYHASLLQGGYSEFCALAGPVVLHAVLADAQKLHTGKQGAGQSWTFQSGKTLFLKVQEPGRVAEMAADQAQRELAGTAQQIHTITRSPLVQDCQAPAPVLAKAPEPIPAARPVAAKPPTPKAPVPRLYALESDALFEFGKSELRANSYNAIEVMAQRLKRDFSGVERIRVVGHTDAIGQPKSNAKLSLERAKVVAQQLQERGLKPSKGFKIEGEGSTHLVKLRCGNKPTPENKLCHAPNRRVDIVVTGASR
jgi:OOP family OmpA-OmpF porin